MNKPEYIILNLSLKGAERLGNPKLESLTLVLGHDQNRWEVRDYSLAGALALFESGKLNTKTESMPKVETVLFWADKVESQDSVEKIAVWYCKHPAEIGAVQDAISQDNKVLAIRNVRQNCNCSLDIAKNFVESLAKKDDQQ